MTTMIDSAPPATGGRFRLLRQLCTFLLLSGMAGVTASMLKVLTPLFALRMDATPMQIGIISSVESLGIAVMTLPAGMAVSRWGARRVYMAGSAVITLVYLVLPFAGSWLLLALAAFTGALCMAYRMVSLSASFMDRLPEFGTAKAGWYRGAGVVGTLLVGPLLAVSLWERLGAQVGYAAVSLLFGTMGLLSVTVLPTTAPSRHAGFSFRTHVAGLLGLLRERAVRSVFTVEVASSMVLSLFSAFIVVIGVTEIGLSDSAAVSVRFLEGVVSVATMFLGGPLLAALPPALRARLGIAVTVAGLLVMAAAHNYALMAGSTVLIGLGLGITHLVNVQRLSALPSDKGKLASLQILFSMAGGFAGALLGGLLSPVVGLHGLFAVAAAGYAVLLVRGAGGRP